MPVRPALDTLRELRDGRFLEDLTDELNELVRQVRTTDKGGTLTVTLNVDPMEKGDATRVIVKDQITAKPPRLKRSTLFYTTPDANLSLRNPNQPDLPGLQDVSYRDEDLDDHTNANEESDSA